MRFLPVVLALFSAMASPNPASAETLRIGGNGAMAEVLRQIGPAFTAASGFTLEVIPGIGTTGGNAAVADGVLGVSVAGRDLAEKEAARGLMVATTLRTPYGFVTSRPGPDGFASDGIAGIFDADNAIWPDGTPIRIILRLVGGSDNLFLGNLIPGLAEAIEHARTRPDLSVAATDQEGAELAEKTEGSLLGATLTQIMTEKRDLRFVTIDGVAATMANYEDGSYPYGKTLYLVVATEVSPAATSFLSFIGTPEGEAILRQAGMIAGDE